MTWRHRVVLAAGVALALGGAWLRQPPAAKAPEASAHGAPVATTESGAPAPALGGSADEGIVGTASAVGAGEGRPAKAHGLPMRAGLVPPRVDALHPMTTERRHVVEERSARATTLNRRLRSHIDELRSRREQPGADREQIDRDLAALERHLHQREELEFIASSDERPGARR